MVTLKLSDRLFTVSDGQVRIWGGALVRDLNEYLSQDLPEGEADTVGGFVFGRMGRVGAGHTDI